MVQVVSRPRDLADNAALPNEHATRVGDVLLDFIIEDHPEYVPRPRRGLSEAELLIAVQRLLDCFEIGGYMLSSRVILLPRGSPKLGTPQMLPYSRWLDWCSIAYFAPESLARRATGMELLLQRLRAVGQDEARGKLRALAATREAFTMRQGRSASEPSAAEYLLGEMCDLGRRHRAARAAGNQVGNGSASAAGGAGGDLTRCLLL